MPKTFQEMSAELQRQWAQNGSVDKELVDRALGDPTKTVSNSTRYDQWGNRIDRAAKNR